MTKPEESLAQFAHSILSDTSAPAVVSLSHNVRVGECPSQGKVLRLAAALIGYAIMAGCSGGSGSGGSGQAKWTDGLCSDVVAKGSPGLVDDLNDGDGYIFNNDGRRGVWYTYNDGTGNQTPAGTPPGPPYVCKPRQRRLPQPMAKPARREVDSHPGVAAWQ